MMTFTPGDFVCLKDLAKIKTSRILNKNVNVFEIIEIDQEFVKLGQCLEKLPLNEILPIPINGKDDLEIYFDPDIAASVVAIGDPIPVITRNTSYYLKTFNKSYYEGDNLFNIVQKLGFKYVHEIQHYLKDNLKQKLKIKAL